MQWVAEHQYGKGSFMWTLILYIIVIILAIYFYVTAESPTQTTKTLTDIEGPTAEEGRAVPVIFGTCLLKSPNMVWYGDLKYKVIKDYP